MWLKGLDITITAEGLTAEAFAPFGDVISNPSPDRLPSSVALDTQPLPSNAVSANQGTAIQYKNVSRPRNLYEEAPSGQGSPILSIFSCQARQLELCSDKGLSRQLLIPLLERHPFTTQTFTPIQSTASSYLVVVAPSLEPSSLDEHLLAPATAMGGHPGRGLPDLRRIRAFLASSRQAVTYGAGTWHSPMITLGQPKETLDFVVSQFASGVADEDCQIVQLGPETSPRIAKVRIPVLEGRPKL